MERVGVLVSFLKMEMLSLFYHWEWLLWICHVWPLLCCGSFPLCLLFLNSFYNKWVMNFVKSFSASIEMIVCVCVLFFSLLIWCITLIDLYMLMSPCIPGINPIWSWCMMCWWIQLASVLLRTFTSMLISDRSIVFFFFFGNIFVWFWYQGNGGLIEGAWKCYFLSNFLE